MRNLPHAFSVHPREDGDLRRLTPHSQDSRMRGNARGGCKAPPVIMPPHPEEQIVRFASRRIVGICDSWSPLICMSGALL